MADAIAGPSRAATVKDEAEDYADSTTVAAATNGSSSTAANAKGANANDDETTAEELGPDGLPKDASETLYLHNLNEKVQISVMKQTLKSLFKPYFPLAPITAHRNVQMRGQAFISFRDKKTADQARRDVNEFPLYGKPIIIQFAKTRADIVVEREDGAGALEEWKKTRVEEKKDKRRTNLVRLKQRETQKAGTDEGAPSVKKPRLQMPDEYLPPNNVLFVQNLPEGTTQEDLREVFEPHPGLVEIRTIAAKRDIAFIEYADEASATVAKGALHNFKIDGETKMKVTYARK